MARARSPDSIKAEELFHQGGKTLAEIAKILNVPEGTVRRWKSTQKWEKKSERSDKEKANVRKRGAPKGNKNAKGNKGGPGGPIGNQKAVKHGGYRGVYFDTLDEEELEMIGDMPDETEILMVHTIELYTVRERRLMKAINQYKEGGKAYVAGTMVVQTKRRFKKDSDEQEEYERLIQEKVENGERLPGEPYQETIQTFASIDLITRLEKELTSVQRSKQQALEGLTRYRLEKEKMSGNTKENDLVRAWTEKVKQQRKENGNG